MARILIIEDNPDNLALMRYLLQAFGHATLSAPDGEEGLRRAEEEEVDLVLCDIQLPKLDGYEVARRLKARPEHRGPPLVAVTALAMVGDRDKVLAAGFDGYIGKPIDPRAFVGQVESFLPADTTPVPLITPDAALEPPPEPRATSPPAGARILVVDDILDNRELALAMLAPFGYRVTLADSVADAMALLGQAPFDLILSDLQMPEDDGFRLLEQVKSDPALRALPFVLVSSSLWDERDRGRALALGADVFLLRPVEPRRLLDEIAVRLAEARG